MTRPGVQVIVPNPKTSAAGRWAFLALWGATGKAKTYKGIAGGGAKREGIP